jgi:hypothetical protein
MTINPPSPNLDHTPITIYEAADIVGVRPSVLEDLARWGELPSATIDGQLTISRATLDGLFDAGIGIDHSPEIDL